MNLYDKDNLNNILKYNQLFYNLLKNKIHENEIILFIEDVINIDDEVKNIIVTDDILNCDLNLEIDTLLIDITKNKLEDKEVYRMLKMIFKSYGYDYVVDYDFTGRRFIFIDFR